MSTNGSTYVANDFIPWGILGKIWHKGDEKLDDCSELTKILRGEELGYQITLLSLTITLIVTVSINFCICVTLKKKVKEHQ